jgi:4-methylaminobutanoate oxidase (formaldehyde-forming)
MAFVNAAKIIGVKFKKNTEVIDLLNNEQVVTGVRTKTGIYDADIVVLAAGVWSTYLASKIGIALPMAPVRSQYWITDQSESLFLSSSPTVIIPDANFYSRPQGKSLLFGIREENSVYCELRILPKELRSYQFSRDNGWQDLIESYDKIAPFFPQFRDTRINHYIAGFSAYTPDNMFIAGEAPGIKGLFIASGCVGAGISVAGGIGLGISQLAAGKANSFDFSQYRVDRFGTFDPFSKKHLSRCAATRSKKICG